MKPIHEQPPIWIAGLFTAVIFVAATSSVSLAADATDAISPSVVQQGVQASPIPFDDGWPVPQALDEDGLARIRDGFAAAAQRAVSVS